MNIIDFSKDFAISLWFNATTFNTNGPNELITNPNGQTGGIGIQVTNGNAIGINRPSIVNNDLCSYNFQTGTWYHIVVSRNSGNFNVWINGVAQSVSYGDSNDYSGPIALGWDGQNSNNGFNGKIDEVGVWVKPLRQADVTALYNFGLANQYPFNNPPVPPFVTNGLIFYTDALGYAGDGNSWIDQSSGLVGTNNGGATYNSQAPSYFNFNGGQSIDFQDPNHILDLTNNFTLETWCYITSNNQWGALLSYANAGNNPSDGEQFAIGTNGNQTFYFSCFSLIQQVYNGPSYDLNTWYHLVVTFQDGNVTFYLNGVNVYSAYFGYNSLPSVTSPYLSIGDNQYGGQEYLYGNVGLSRIYNRVLSTNEITQNYNVTKERFTGLTVGLQAYWKLDNYNGNVSLIDSSGNNNTLTNYGGVTLGQGIIAGDAVFNGSNYLEQTSLQLNLASDPFTISFWFNANDVSSAQTLIGWVFGLNIWLHDGIVDVDNYSYTFNLYGSVTANTWTMVTISGDGNGINLYIDGNFINSAPNNFQNIGGLDIGCGIYGGIINAYTSSIDEIGVWNRKFSQEEVTKLYNTGQGLTYPFIQQPYNLKDGVLGYWSLDDNTWSDSTGNGYNLTASGNVTNGTGVINNDAIFNGIDGYLTTPSLNFSGDFTISFWGKVNSGNSSTGGFFIGDYTSGLLNIYIQNGVSGTVSVSYATTYIISPVGNVNGLVFNHYCLTRNSGLFTLYINGESVGTATNNTDWSGSYALGYSTYYNRYLNGELDEVGIWNRALSRNEVSYLYNDGRALAYPFLPTNGLALWLDASDSETTIIFNDGPYTADSNTSLLMHFDDSNGSTTFTDSSNNNINVTLGGGSPVISTSQSEFGGSSLYLDGSSYLVLDGNSDAFNLSNTPFTINACFYALNLPSNVYQSSVVIISKDTYGSNFSWHVCLAANGFALVTANAGAVYIFPTNNISLNTWHHVSYVHDGTNLSIYLDGNLASAPQAVTITDAGSNISIGCVSWNNPSAFFNGYIDELRVVKGVAIVPSAPAPATNGQSVSKWSDKSGKNNHATQSNSSLQPVLATNSLNGKSTLYFDGTQNKMFNLVNNIGGSTYSLFIVAKNTDNSVGSFYFWNKENNYAQYIAIDTESNYNPDIRNKFVLANHDDGSGYNSNMAYGGLVINNDYFLGSIVRNNTDIKVSSDGVKGDVTGSFNTDDIIETIGGYHPNNTNYAIKGNIAEIIAYNRALSDTEKYAVETYLNNKYNIYTVPNIVQDGLVLWLDANDSRSYPGTGNTWYDLSPSNNNGTLQDGVAFNSGLMQFDGSSGYVNFGSYTPANESFTLEMVFDWGRYNSANVDFLFSGNFEQLELHIGGDTGVNGLRFIPAGNGGTPYYLDETNIVSGGPNHLTFVWDADSSTAYLYKNGAIDTSSFLHGSSIKTLQALNIGRRSDGRYGNDYFQGDVYITRLYNRALNSTEVAQNFNVSRSRFGL
jgi:Concanavalin A-like lectin/glucanases superfamily